MKSLAKLIAVITLIASLFCLVSMAEEAAPAAEAVVEEAVVEETVVEETDEAGLIDEEAPEMPVEEIVDEFVAPTFEGRVEVKLENSDVYFGDEIVLKAVVTNPTDVKYSLQWQVDSGNGWKDIKGETDDEYKFTVNEENAEYEFRVVVISD